MIYNGLGGAYFDLTEKKDSVELCYLKAFAIKRKIMNKDTTTATYFEYLKTASNLIAVYADTYSCQQGSNMRKSLCQA